MACEKVMAVLALFILTGERTVAQDERVRVACIGNSVTYGMTLENRERACYPAQLQEMLGMGYEVKNFGHSGATLMRNGHNPYHKLPEYRKALDFKGDIVVIHLGLNDTDPRNWEQRGEEFVSDYRMLIDSLRAVNPECKVYVCLMTPIFHGHKRYLSGTRDWHAEIQQAIRTVAEGADAELIDLFTPLHSRPDCFPDNLHPNAKGARILAETVYDAITGYAHRGLTLPITCRNGMVLQREAQNTIRGTAPIGSRIELQLGKTTYRTIADTHGKWTVDIKPMKKGGPYRMNVSMTQKNGRVSSEKCKVDGRKTVGSCSVTVDSVYIGEVWLCSGQSNMEWVNGNLPVDFRPGICRTGVADDADRRLHLFQMKGMRGITSDGPWDKELLDAVDDLHFVQDKGWMRASKSTVTDFSAIGYRVGHALADSLDCHVGIIMTAVGGSGIESWIDRTTTEYTFPEVLVNGRPAENDFYQDWVRRCIQINTQGSPNPLQRHPFEACYLYESSIAPLEGLTLRGVMWYQGESNAHNLDMYQRQWAALVGQWRSVFRSADGGLLPFYTCQLSGIGGRPSWGRFRDMQRRLADADPRVYLVVSHDVGEQWNVHPKRKDIQALRLSNSIMHHEYGHTAAAADSPYVLDASVNKGVVTLVFSEDLACDEVIDDCKDLPVADGDWFELSGKDGLYHSAKATMNGCVLTLSCSEIGAPVSVRYAWRDFTRATLRGKSSGLPLSSFRYEL